MSVSTPETRPAPDAGSARPGTPAFEVHLDNFSGPFDLLLSLIAKHQMDITEVALATVTDDFIAHIRRAEGVWDLDQASEFLVVAATLLDLKAARLLPSGQVEDAEDLALLEARDLLFARLLQYRAYKLVAGELATRFATSGRRRAARRWRSTRTWPVCCPSWSSRSRRSSWPRSRPARWRRDRGPPEVGLDHLHGSAVSVAEQAEVVVTRMRRSGVATFRDLVADAESTLVVVARFLALLELFRESAVTFEQASALGELTVRWTGTESGAVQVSDEFDEPDETDGDEQA